MVQNPNMYENYDMTIRDQLTNSIYELHQTWCLLESYEISETAIGQLCQTAANHFKILHIVHSCLRGIYFKKTAPNLTLEQS